jgi:hypothetical protein
MCHSPTFLFPFSCGNEDLDQQQLTPDIGAKSKMLKIPQLKLNPRDDLMLDRDCKSAPKSLKMIVPSREATLPGVFSDNAKGLKSIIIIDCQKGVMSYSQQSQVNIFCIF